MKFREAFAWLAIALGGVSGGCAHPSTPYRVRYADLGRAPTRPWDGWSPLVVEFEAGERIPVDFEFSGEDFALAPAKPTLELVAKQHCFVRFSKEGVRSSLNAEDFDGKPRQPGSFRLGLNARHGEQPYLEVVIVTPRR